MDGAFETIFPLSETSPSRERSRPKGLNPEVSQALYYASDARKISAREVRRRLREYLFDTFSSNDDRITGMRDSIVAEVVSEYQKVDRVNEKDAEGDVKDRQISSLTSAINNLVALTTFQSNEDLDVEVARVKLQMLRSLLG